MLQLPRVRRRARAYFSKPRIIVVADTFERALTLAAPVERAVYAAVPTTAGEIGRVAGLDPAPVAALLAPELPTAHKKAVCQFLRAIPGYENLRIVAFMALVEGSANVPADAVLRPPAGIKHVLRALNDLLAPPEKATVPPVA